MIDIAGLKPASRGAWGAEIRATLVLAWPLILTNLTQVALGTTDVVMMGWLGPKALAAGALATNLNFALLIFGMGLVTATSPMIASELGRMRHSVRDVRRTVRQGFWAAVAIAIPIMAILWHAETILIALGQEPALAAAAAAYNHTLMFGVLPFLGYIVLRNFVSAMERPKAAMWIGIGTVFLNAFLVWVLMFGHLGFPALGLVGAGIGTALTNVAMFLGLAAVVSYDRRFRRYHLFGRWWRADWPRFREIWRLGLPIALTLGFEVTIFNAATFVMGWIGPDALAAHAIAIQIPSVAFMVPLGLGMAATVRVGRAYGARDWEGAAIAGWTAWGLALAYCCFTALAMVLAGRPLVGLFLDLANPEYTAVVNLAVGFLVFAGLFQLVDGAQVTGAGMLRGLHDTRIPMLLAGLGYWVIGAPLGLLLAFPAGLAGTGIWIGLSIGLAVVAALLTLRWMMRERIGLVGDGAHMPAVL